MVSIKHILEGLHNQAEILERLVNEGKLDNDDSTSLTVALLYNWTICHALGDDNIEIQVEEL